MGTVCETCGDEGFVEALVYCDSCKIGAVHRYCCGITPVPIDDYVIWFCSDCEGSDTGSDCKQVDQVAILTKSEKRKKKKKKKKNQDEEGSNHTPPGLDVEHHELQDSTNVESVEVFSAPPIIEAMEEQISGSRKSNELTDLVGNEASVSAAMNEKEKKKKRKSITHSLPDATDVEPVEVSKKRDVSDTGKSDEVTGLLRNKIYVLEKSEKKRKKKKKRNKESSNHTLPVLEAEGHGLQDTTNVEAMKESKNRKRSDIRESEELNGLVRNEVSVLEKKEKKKKKKKKTNKEEKWIEESNYHTSPVLDAEDHGLQDATSAEPMKESTKPKTSDSRNCDELNGLVRNEVSVLEKSEKKKKMNKEEKKNEESSNHTWSVLAVEDSWVQDTINLEPAKAQESLPSGKPHELIGLAKYAASVVEGVNSSTVPDQNCCTTSKKRRLSSGNIRVTSENTQLAAENISCKEAESNMPQTNEVLTATDFNSHVLNNDRALPIFKPIWSGSISVKHGNICRVDGLDAHLSSLACHKVHEKASSLHACLAAEMFPRLEIWPESFLKNGPPTDGSIALYFFPSRDSNYEKVYYSLVHEMKKNDLAMRCVLDNVELLLFTSYQLPMDCWQFHSKEYVWGIFRRKKTSRH